MSQKLPHTIVLLMVLMLFLVSPDQVNAETNHLNTRLNGGIDTIKYWRDPYCDYTTTISLAHQNWMYPGWSNPIDFVEQSTNANSKIDYFRIDDNVGYFAAAPSYGYGNTSSQHEYTVYEKSILTGITQ